ncbi:uncharacterized protein LOC144135509 [Amblyomma americanum]
MNVALATAFVVASLFAGSEAQGGIKGQQQLVFPPGVGGGTKGGGYWEGGSAGGGGFFGGGMGTGGGAFKGMKGGQIKGGVPPFQGQQQQPFPGPFPMGPPPRPQLQQGQQPYFG